MPEIIILIIVLAILFDISNGWNDSANAIATVVSTRVLTPTKAVLLAAGMNVLGAFSTTAVAKTIGTGIVDPKAVTAVVVAAALSAGFTWNTAMTKLGMPVSASHALIGGLIGASVSYGGIEILNITGLMTIFSALLISPILGIMLGFSLMKVILKIFGTLPAGTINKYFGKLQLLSSGFMAFSHGSNDAQKVMGIITLSLVSAGVLHSVDVPFWVILICALAMGLGTAIGGWKVIKTMGVHMLKLEPVHGFAAETSATAVILGASQFGLPVSTTHVIATAIMGVGATKRLSAVRWGIAGKIVLAWVFTLPVCALLAWGIYKALLLIV
ncbi:MAG: inorganic phosphate transporter [Nitrospirae bacterium]|nr:inorganic phosphate transporter [Nitrospirota bacterium]